jgi:hypothetical protein
VSTRSKTINRNGCIGTSESGEDGSDISPSNKDRISDAFSRDFDLSNHRQVSELKEDEGKTKILDL